MAKLCIVKEPDEILRKKSKEVVEFSFRLHQLLDDMRETMRGVSGLGIAAVQVGVLYRACIVGDTELVNPVIISFSGSQRSEEGCLSVRGRRGFVKRPKRVVVRAVTRDGEPFEKIFSGHEAVCACHEIDHLDGVLFTDKIEG